MLGLAQLEIEEIEIINLEQIGSEDIILTTTTESTPETTDSMNMLENSNTQQPPEIFDKEQMELDELVANMEPTEEELDEEYYFDNKEEGVILEELTTINSETEEISDEYTTISSSIDTTDYILNELEMTFPEELPLCSETESEEVIPGKDA